MKKLLCLFLLVACSLVLISCVDISALLGQGKTCTAHIDNNGDLKCDLCQTAVECTSHKDKDKDLECDKCGATVQCTHKDADHDGECDIDACDYVFCEHEYSDEYSHNRTHHYFLPTCDCNIDPKDNEPHADDNNDGVCDVCEWDYNHKHTYQNTYTHDKTHHWYEPTCDHDVKKSLATHSDENKDSICDTCFWDYDHEHTYEEEWSHDETKHWYDVTCEHLIDVKNEGNHIDLNNDGACDICAWDNGHVHTYAEGDAWSTDGEYHWHAATCGHDVPGIDKEAHVNETDSEGKEDGECDECGYNMCGPNHTFNPDKWGADETGHWHPSKCGHSTADMERKGHDDGKVNDGICEECGYVMCNHPYEEEIYDKDETHHWNQFTCDDTVVPDDRKTAHEDCDENNDGICDVCRYQFCQHEFDDTKWAYAEGGTTHWHPTVCDHNVDINKKDEAGHVDNEGNDGVCDICEYQICKHPQSDSVYDKDKTHHWFDFTDCEHEVPEELKKLHEDCDENNDGICDTCSYQYCTHPQSETEYSYDLKSHWYTFTECNHEVPEVLKTLHDDENEDGVCTVCGQYCQHTFDTENWASDATNHYHAASCGHKVPNIDVEAHTDNADNNGICDVCGYVSCTHTWASVWSSDATGHWHDVTCTHSVGVIDYAIHKDEEGNDGLCDTCDYQVCNHTYVTEYTQDTIDKDYHWFATICEHVVPESAKEKHTDSDHDGFCEVCMLQFCTHPLIEGQYDSNETHHWNKTECEHELPVEERELHDDDDNDGNCTACGQYCVHTDQTEWEYDSNATHHWKKFSDCGHVEHDTEAEHTDTDNNNKCDICERKYISDGLVDVDTSDPIETPPFVVTPKEEGEE